MLVNLLNVVKGLNINKIIGLCLFNRYTKTFFIFYMGGWSIEKTSVLTSFNPAINIK